MLFFSVNYSFPITTLLQTSMFSKKYIVSQKLCVHSENQLGSYDFEEKGEKNT